jgi:cob(I)alamin adenosyltransferase
VKLYTRTGDDGTTGLHGGNRVRKDDPRIEALGAVDELNAHLGLARATCDHDELDAILSVLQSRLFDLGADLASPGVDGISRMGLAHAEEAESQIDRLSEPLEPLKNFILPGGGELASRLHVARGVCRRAERQCVTLGGVESIVTYLNRVSDLLFAMARRANQLAGVSDVPWTPRTR